MPGEVGKMGLSYSLFFRARLLFVIAGRARPYRRLAHTRLRPHFRLDLGRDFLMLAQIILGVFAALAQALFAIREEGPTLGDNFKLGAQVDDIAFLGNAFV